MERVLEPEYVDTPKEADSYDAMDHAPTHGALVARFLELGGDTGTVVDLGTGPGHVPIRLARECPELRVVGVDAAEHMLALARPRATRLGLEDRVEFRRADVKALPFGDAVFDAVLSNTILHHIPEPRELLAEAWRVLKPDGVLLIRDLFRPESRAAAEQLVDLHAAGGTAHHRAMLLHSLCAALTLDEARTLAEEAGITGARVAMVSDRHYDIEVAG